MNSSLAYNAKSKKINQEHIRTCVPMCQLKKKNHDFSGHVLLHIHENGLGRCRSDVEQQVFTLWQLWRNRFYLFQKGKENNFKVIFCTLNRFQQGHLMLNPSHKLQILYNWAFKKVWSQIKKLLHVYFFHVFLQMERAYFLILVYLSLPKVSPPPFCHCFPSSLSFTLFLS